MGATYAVARSGRRRATRVCARCGAGPGSAVKRVGVDYQDAFVLREEPAAGRETPQCFVDRCPVLSAIRHCDELPWGAGLLGYRIDWATHRPAGLEASAGHASGSRRHG